MKLPRPVKSRAEFHRDQRQSQRNLLIASMLNEVVEVSKLDTVLNDWIVIYHAAEGGNRIMTRKFEGCGMSHLYTSTPTFLFSKEN